MMNLSFDNSAGSVCPIVSIQVYTIACTVCFVW